MNIYQDNLLINENGELFTGEYIDHNSSLNNYHTFTQLTDEKKWQALRDSTQAITCNYSQLFRDFDNLILNNYLLNALGYENFEQYNGCDYDDENDSYTEIYQYYIINGNAAEHLADHTHEIIYYNENADLYLLGVSHFGTSWNYVGAEYLPVKE